MPTNAMVVHDFLWGNTAEVARALTQGLGPGFGFMLSSPRMREGIRRSPARSVQERIGP
jgi:hypothetical protein